MRQNKEAGQVLLVVVLVMVVALTVGLSVLSRSITDLRNSVDEENSQRAFSAAEAGIEHFLKNTCSGTTRCTVGEGTNNNISLGNNATLFAEATPIAGDKFLLNGGAVIAKDDGIDLWLSDYSDDPALMYQNRWNNNVAIFWGDPSVDDCDNAAIEVIILSGITTANATSKRVTADPCQPRRQTNNFSPSSSGGESVGGVSFRYKMTINIADGLIARIVPLYKNAQIGVSGEGFSLPQQGSVITSTGTSGDTKRKISLVGGYPGLPAEFFQYILFQTCPTSQSNPNACL